MRAIWRRIAAENESAADALVMRILDKLGLAAEHPAIGAPRRFLGPTARILVEGRHVVIYEPTDYGVLAVAIVHGARDPETWIRAGAQ